MIRIGTTVAGISVLALLVFFPSTSVAFVAFVLRVSVVALSLLIFADAVFDVTINIVLVSVVLGLVVSSLFPTVVGISLLVLLLFTKSSVSLPIVEVCLRISAALTLLSFVESSAAVIVFAFVVSIVLILS